MMDVNKRIIIAGGSGLIGTQLNQLLNNKGYSTSILGRSSSNSKASNKITWAPDQHSVDSSELEGCHAIVNLAGAGVMDHAWTEGYRKTILSSRVDTNKTLEQAMSEMHHKPIYVSASAIGYYGYRQGNTPFHEDDLPASNGFLEEVTLAWEAAAQRAGRHATRHVGVRIGLVLSNNGGALAEMMKGFKFGFGSYFAPGDQWYSWIHIDDLCGIIIQAIESQSMSKMYNGVAPHPASSKEIAEQIAFAKYGKSRLLAVPEFTLKLALGERRHTLLGSCYVSSQKTENTGFKFEYPTIESAIKQLVG